MIAAYIVVIRVTLEVIPKHKAFSAQDIQYQQLRTRLNPIVSRLAILGRFPLIQAHCRLEQIKIKLKGLALGLNTSASIQQQSPSNPSKTETFGFRATPSSGQTFPSITSQTFPSIASHNSQQQLPQDLKKSTLPSLTSISAIELQTTLATTAPRILIFDLRPTEVFIQGHLGWRSIQSPPTSGLVNLEPEWVSEGTTGDDIEQYLGAFGSSNNTSALLFQQRYT